MLLTARSQSNVSFGLGFTERWLLSTLTTLPCFVLILINVTMLVTLRRKKVFGETSRYILLFNLLLADTVLTTLNQLLYILSMGGLFLSYPVCGVLIMIATLTNEVSPLTLVAMSLERYVAVSFPLRHAVIVTMRGTVAVIGVLWAFCSLNILVRVLLLLEFPFDRLESLQMQHFCSSFLMFITPKFHEYDKAYTCFLFISASIAVMSSYIGVMVVAQSASKDTSSARKTRNTLLLHLIQLALSLFTTMHNSLLLAMSTVVRRRVLVAVQNVFYVFIIMLPKCLNPLIYVLRDPVIRPVFMGNFRCPLKN
ncbi:odorant receptor 131-2-like [Pholidichthys leucotaenia]